MIWDKLTSQQISRLDKNIPVVLVIAATEQHGPHLPLATDRLIGDFFANQLNESMPDMVLILPTIAIGCSDHHMSFPGTLSLSHETFSRQVREVIDSVIKHGFHKIVLLNSHGGNQGIGQVVIEQLGYTYKYVRFVMVTWWRIAVGALSTISETGRGGVGHACEFETSLMLLIAPDLVIKENIEKGGNRKTFSWADGDMLRGSQALYYRSIKEMTPNGIFGDPTAASLEKGIEITAAVMTPLRQLITDLFQVNK